MMPGADRAGIVDIAALIETKTFDRFALRLLLGSMLITFFDGFDLSALSFAAPYVAAELGLDTLSLGYVFSTGLAGTLIGAFATGPLADHYGRRPVILLSTVAFGLLTLAFVAVAGFPLLIALRFVQGIALGGLMPLCWTLNIDYAPKRRRATIATFITIGFGLGSGLAGPISVALIPRFGWHSLFVFGGVGALLTAALLWRGMPESLRYLAMRAPRSGRMRRAFHCFAPEVTLPAAPQFVLSDETDAPRRLALTCLFEGRLALITPLIWAAYLASSISAYLLASWGPLLFEAVGFDRAQSAYIASFNTLAGIAGGLLVMRFTDRLGVLSIAAMPLVAIPLMLALGLLPLAAPSFVAFSILIGVFLLGGHYGVMSIIGLFYPGATRATGTGTAAAVAKIGSVLGPLLGGLLFSMQFPARMTFALIAVCPLTLLLCLVLLARIERSDRKA
jgi:AAHS family 4-hydroxybenzoate transporter-like MFS transporter